MKVAIPVWDNCVSSVLDFAHRLLLVNIEKGNEVSRSEISLIPESIPQRAARLKSLGIEVLICGAISRSLATQVAASGIEVLPYVVGQVDEILKAYVAGQLAEPQFAMPGCWQGARKDFARGRCRCRRQARHGKAR